MPEEHNKDHDSNTPKNKIRNLFTIQKFHCGYCGKLVQTPCNSLQLKYCSNYKSKK